MQLKKRTFTEEDRGGGEGLSYLYRKEKWGKILKEKRILDQMESTDKNGKKLQAICDCQPGSLGKIFGTNEYHRGGGLKIGSWTKNKMVT